MKWDQIMASSNWVVGKQQIREITDILEPYAAEYKYLEKEIVCILFPT